MHPSPTPGARRQPQAAAPLPWAWHLASPWCLVPFMLLWPLSAWPEPWDLRLQRGESFLASLLLVALPLGWLWSLGWVLLRPGTRWLMVPRSLACVVVGWAWLLKVGLMASLAPPAVQRLAFHLNDALPLGPKPAAMPRELLGATLLAHLERHQDGRLGRQERLFDFPPKLVEHLRAAPRERRWPWHDPTGGFFLTPPTAPTAVGALCLAHFPEREQVWLAQVLRAGWGGAREWQVMGPLDEAWPRDKVPTRRLP